MHWKCWNPSLQNALELPEPFSSKCTGTAGTLLVRMHWNCQNPSLQTALELLEPFSSKCTGTAGTHLFKKHWNCRNPSLQGALLPQSKKYYPVSDHSAPRVSVSLCVHRLNGTPVTRHESFPSVLLAKLWYLSRIISRRPLSTAEW